MCGRVHMRCNEILGMLVLGWQYSLPIRDPLSFCSSVSRINLRWVLSALLSRFFKNYCVFLVLVVCVWCGFVWLWVFFSVWLVFFWGQGCLVLFGCLLFSLNKQEVSNPWSLQSCGPSVKAALLRLQRKPKERLTFVLGKAGAVQVKTSLIQWDKWKGSSNCLVPLQISMRVKKDMRYVINMHRITCLWYLVLSGTQGLKDSLS